MKFLWIDTETTGTDPVENGVIQIAGMMYDGGKKLEEFEFFSRTNEGDIIEPKALEVNGRTEEEIAGFPEPMNAYSSLKALLDKYINKYDKQDKFVAAGQNVRFDVNMMGEFWKKTADDPYFFSYVHGATFDTLNMAIMMEMRLKRKCFKDHKLGTLCESLGVKLDNAHDALADIKATRNVAQIMWKIITTGSG